MRIIGGSWLADLRDQNIWGFEPFRPHKVGSAPLRGWRSGLFLWGWSYVTNARL